MRIHHSSVPNRSLTFPARLGCCLTWFALMGAGPDLSLTYASTPEGEQDPVKREAIERGCASQEIRCSKQSGDTPSFASLTIELAATYKTLGDQEFLLDVDRAKATDNYCTAEQYTHEIDKQAQALLSDADLEVLRLLQADIAYRKQLLRGGASFWGLEGSTPGNPLRQLAAFKSSFATYDSSVGEITDSLRASREARQQQIVAASQDVEHRLKRFVQQQQESIGAIKVSRYDSTLGNARRRQQEVRRELEGIERQANELATRASNLNAQIGKSIVDALASSAGVPPGMLSALQSGNLTDAVKTAALTALSDPALLDNPAIAGALEDLSTRAPDLSNMMRQVADAKKAVDELQGQLVTVRYGIDAAGRFQRDPSFESLLALGEASWKTLPKVMQDKLRTGVESFKPVGTVVQLASQASTINGQIQNQVKATREVLAKALAEVDQDGRLLAAEAIAFSREVTRSGDWQQVTQVYRDTFNQTISAIALTESNAQRLADQLIRITPEGLLDWLDLQGAHRVGALLRVNGLNNRDELIRRLRTQGLASIRGLEVRTVDQVRKTGIEALFVNGSQVDDLPRVFRELTARLPASGTPAALADNLEEVLGLVAAQGEQARTQLTQSFLETSPVIIQRLVNKATLTAEDADTAARRRAEQIKSQLWSKINDKLPKATKTSTLETAAKLLAGSGMAKEAVDRQDQATVVLDQVKLDLPRASVALGQAPSANDAAMRQMATIALDAVCPGMGVAAGVVSNMIALNGMWDKLNELFDDQKRLMTEERQLIATIQAAELDKAIAEKERAVAGASVAAAEAQIDLWQQASAQASTDAEIERAIIRARRPLIFFTGEELRRHFDLFNRSMTLWTGIGGQGRPFLETYIKNNPQYLRLAVDHDIQLYGWLNRERDGARIDLDLVARRWQQKLALLESVCTDNIIGCVPGTGRSHEITQNQARLSGLMSSSQRQQFKSMLEKRVGEGEYRVAFNPAAAPLASQYRNVRLLDVRMTWVDSDGRALPDVVHGITLTHPGYAALIGAAEDGVRLRQEILAPQQQGAFELGPFTDVKAMFGELKGVSAEQMALAPNPRLYGYSPLTIWNLKVNGNAIPSGARDLVIHIAYVFSRDDNLTNEAQFVELLRQRTPQAASPVLADARRDVWREFPVGWYRMAQVKPVPGQAPGTWVQPISGPLSAMEVYLHAGMAPTQFDMPAKLTASHGYCPTELTAAPVARDGPSIAAVCLPDDTIARKVSNQLLTHGLDPNTGLRLTRKQASEQTVSYLIAMKASGLCNCPGNRPAGAVCTVQSKL
ncbi:hypothetical protein G1E_25761 [Pseudomonas sp. TJI-51]|uniref:hypothetical protein n=1 Tax=Pseudomonas TaxID=286 RepID=UPI0001FB8E91|nr:MULTISPECIES: hypothetical protein [Pseudomonas]EGB96020.1 hypothetical protein G1E_25761 [Pseudomonas sp. TJI-51]